MMLEMMEEMFPREVTWRKPKGGMFLWGILPEGMDSAEVLKRAVKGGWHSTGQAVSSQRRGHNTMSINFRIRLQKPYARA